ncbi:hypothetical protein [Achromobacter sp. ACRQX]|uniref:hypothetical protein n=1 Tax=Achromobacter sp. ACRQX TaxID=2918181 RepID=UPI001EF24B0A|nr:hypothetical protein [Achromobacter sp. ACRQX]MCG7324321.1 hypothetical protein [Achromobacter sp. ACRQX]
MTTNTPAQHEARLTVEEIRSIWVEHGLDDEAVEDFARAIESAVLSKLRAPVAGERAALQRIVDTAKDGANSGDRHARCVELARAALASAPVAGEAQPVAWRYQTPTGWHATTDAQKAVNVRAHHPVEPLYAAPQASEAVRDWTAILPQPHTDMRYHGEFVRGWNQCLQQVHAALSAQPGAQENGGSDAE